VCYLKQKETQYFVPQHACLEAKSGLNEAVLPLTVTLQRLQAPVSLHKLVRIVAGICRVGRSVLLSVGVWVGVVRRCIGGRGFETLRMHEVQAPPLTTAMGFVGDIILYTSFSSRNNQYPTTPTTFAVVVVTRFALVSADVHVRYLLERGLAGQGGGVVGGNLSYTTVETRLKVSIRKSTHITQSYLWFAASKPHHWQAWTETEKRAILVRVAVAIGAIVACSTGVAVAAGTGEIRQ